MSISKEKVKNFTSIFIFSSFFTLFIFFIIAVAIFPLHKKEPMFPNGIASSHIMSSQVMLAEKMKSNLLYEDDVKTPIIKSMVSCIESQGFANEFSDDLRHTHFMFTTRHLQKKAQNYCANQSLSILQGDGLNDAKVILKKEKMYPSN